MTGYQHNNHFAFNTHQTRCHLDTIHLEQANSSHYSSFNKDNFKDTNNAANDYFKSLLAAASAVDLSKATSKSIEWIGQLIERIQPGPKKPVLPI